MMIDALALPGVAAPVWFLDSVAAAGARDEEERVFDPGFHHVLAQVPVAEQCFAGGATGAPCDTDLLAPEATDLPADRPVSRAGMAPSFP